jgi:hypothetical protein
MPCHCQLQAHSLSKKCSEEWNKIPTLTSMSSETLLGESGATPPSVGSLLRCRGDPCFQGRCETLFKPTPTSTQTSCVSLSTGWSSPSKGGTTLIISSSYCWKNSRQPSYKWAPQQCLIHLSCSNHLPIHQVGMSRTRNRSPLTFPAMMGHSD